MWYSLARPQLDGSDVPLLAQREHVRTGWTKRTPTSTITLLDGTIAVHPGTHPEKPNSTMAGSYAAACTPADLTPEWVIAFEPYLRTWDVGCRALQGYLDDFCAYEMLVDGQRLVGQQRAGCSSGHLSMSRDRLVAHVVQVTKTDLHGCAQGIYHEYAHLRLETLGIEIETHDGTLLLNTPDELYHSSVRFDIKRPMSAVLHGVYAWLMFTENDYHLYRQNVTDLAEFTTYTKHNIPKIQNGIAEIQRYGKFTPDGAEFIRGVYDWADDLCARCTALY
jgi:hypothetical protein